MTTSSASLLRILGSVFYDWLIVLSLLMIGGFFIVPLYSVLSGNESFMAGSPFFRLYVLAIITLYFGYFWMRSGQTVGMKAWRIKLIGVENPKITAKQVIIRLIVAMPAYGFALLGLFWRFIDPHQRSWLDLTSNSCLIFLPKTKATR